MFSIKSYDIRSCTYLLALAVFAFVTLHTSLAQSQEAGNLKKEFEQTFQAMLSDPSDIDVTMRYAKLAVQLGDHEAAIPALERILLFNPSLAKVKQELGVLYYRLNSFEVARSYLQDAINTDGVPREVLDKSREYLKKIDAEAR